MSVALIVLSSGYTPNVSTVAAKQSPTLTIGPSNIIDEVADKRRKQPDISPEELAAYANELVEEKGFDYEFNVCEVIGRERLKRVSGTSPSRVVYRYRMTRADGRKVALNFISENPGDAPCGECFSPIPSLQVTRGEMLVVSGGKRHRLRRPPAFHLDEAALVDGTMKKVLRTWQLPYQTVPVGVSPDGRKLYLEFYVEHELGDVVLELAEDGRAQFKARRAVGLQRKGEWIETHPEDRDNAYLSFMRFNAGGKSYIIKFNAPCT